MSTAAEIAATLTRAVEAEVVRIATNVHAELIEATPVDTGFAASSWQLSIGTPAEGTGPGGSLDGYTLDQGSAFATNNASYIQRLNAGHSAQAPAGFVEQAIARGVAS